MPRLPVLAEFSGVPSQYSKPLGDELGQSCIFEYRFFGYRFQPGRLADGGFKTS